MQDRIEIIDSYKSFLGKRKKSIKNRLLYVEILKYFSISLIILVSLITIKSILPFDILKGKLEWQGSELLVLISISYLFNIPALFFESKLLRHLKKLKTNQIKTPSKDILDIELSNIIQDLNANNKTKLFIIILVSVIAIGAIIQLISRGIFDYWDYFKIPFLLLIVFIIINFIKTYLLVIRNIQEYESE